MDWYIKVLKSYVDFEGRARRTEYWMFALINAGIVFLLSLVEMAINVPVLSFIYSLAVLLPSLAVLVRRLHDIGKSGWWLLINFIPVIGSIVLLVFTCLDSQQDENEYGPNPKYDGEFPS